MHREEQDNSSKTIPTTDPEAAKLEIGRNG
jgi:hypothetical protein